MAEKTPKTDTPDDKAPEAPTITLEALAALKGLFTSDLDAARAREISAARAQQAEDDKQRAEGGTVRVVALTSYTVFDDENPRGRVVRAGEEFDLPRFDLPGFEGKVRLKELDAEPETGGVKISAG